MAKFDKQSDDERIDTELANTMKGKSPQDLAALSRLFAKWSKQTAYASSLAKPTHQPKAPCVDPQASRWKWLN